MEQPGSVMVASPPAGAEPEAVETEAEAAEEGVEEVLLLLLA